MKKIMHALIILCVLGFIIWDLSLIDFNGKNNNDTLTMTVEEPIVYQSIETCPASEIYEYPKCYFWFSNRQKMLSNTSTTCYVNGIEYTEMAGDPIPTFNYPDQKLVMVIPASKAVITIIYKRTEYQAFHLAQPKTVNF